MSARTTNTMTLANSLAPSIYGNWINGTGVTFSGTGTLMFAGRGSQTITSAGRTFTQPFTIDTPGGSVTLQDAFETNRSVLAALTVNSGTFNANNYNVTFSNGGVSSSNANTRTIAVGSGTWTLVRTGNSWNTGTVKPHSYRHRHNQPHICFCQDLFSGGILILGHHCRPRRRRDTDNHWQQHLRQHQQHLQRHRCDDHQLQHDHPACC
jgi:hypothetical protein